MFLKKEVSLIVVMLRKRRIMRGIIARFVGTYHSCERIVLVDVPCILFLRLLFHLPIDLITESLGRFCLDLVRWLWFSRVWLRHRLAFPGCGREWNNFWRFLTPGLEDFQCSVNSLTSRCTQLMAFRLFSNKPSMRLIFYWFVRVFKHAYWLQIWHSLRLLLCLFATTNFTFVIDKALIDILEWWTACGHHLISIR